MGRLVERLSLAQCGGCAVRIGATKGNIIAICEEKLFSNLSRKKKEVYRRIISR